MKFLKLTQTSQVLALLSVVSIVMFAGRWIGTGERYYVYLDWNLFLAWIPLWVVQIIANIHQKSPLKLHTLALGLVVWLLFFPNAPYLITDLIHLKNSPDNLIWYDALLHFSFAFSGTLVGLYSMLLAHRLVIKHWGETLGWASVLAASVASSYGIFLGRVGRWNSWDVLSNPLQLVKYSILQLQNTHALQLTFVFSIVTVGMYVAFYGLQKRLDSVSV
jgi:uncharacterized membrane protein